MENPIINNRIVNDCTFANRLKHFIKHVEVFDLPGIEEKEYLLSVANKLIAYQKETYKTEDEEIYLKRIGL